jgi:hypothetical protein
MGISLYVTAVILVVVLVVQDLASYPMGIFTGD